MQHLKRLPRALLFITLLTGLLGGMIAPTLANKNVSAAPMMASSLDVVISEVAWGGTAANSADEWIELYNTTGSTIDLSSWTLSDSSDGSGDINIILSGSIFANGYYLLEKDDDNTISDIAADQIYSGGLNNDGEILYLKEGASIIDTANISGGGWDAGTSSTGSPTYASMERKTTPVISADSNTEWLSNNGVTRNGLAANGTTLVNGTPRTSKVDLSLLPMTVNDSTPNVDDVITFTITVKNTDNVGYGTATNVEVKDLLPAGLTYQSDSPTWGTYDNVSGIWTVGTLAVGASGILTIDAKVATAGGKKNSATITKSDQTDSTSTNNTASKTVTPPGSADLSLTQIVNNDTPNVGDNVVFTITVTNGGPDLATGIEVKDSLPVGLTYVSDNGGGTYDSIANTLTLIVDTLANGASKTLKVTAKVTANGTQTNLAEILSFDQQPDPDTTNNQASVKVKPSGGEADLSLTMNWSKTNTAGTGKFTITVSNAGPYDATNVEVKDLLPTGLTYITHSAPGTTYNRALGIWTVGTLTSGTSKTLTITAKVKITGTRKNLAEVWKSDQSDPNSTPGNASTTAEDDSFIVTPPVADLSLTKKMSNATPNVGQPVVFEIKVSNAGPDDATGVQVKDLLPASYTYVSDNSVGMYNKTSGIWTTGTLASGESKILTITTTVNTKALIINRAEVWKSDQVDPDSVQGFPTNISRTEDDNASAPSADLFLTQSVSDLGPNINTNVIFTITVGNAGPARTTNVQVKDLLPWGLTYVSYSATAGTTYNKTSGIWTVGTLENDEKKVLKITAKVANSGIKTNWAEVWKSDEYDPDSNPGNGSTTEDDDASATITSHRSIIINEVAWSGTAASAKDEWMELYNPGNFSINITGWTLTARPCSTCPINLNITLSGAISAGSYFLLERDDNFTVTNIAANQIYTGELSNSGEILTLLDGSGNYIDTANGNGGAWPAGSLGPYYGSMERQGTSSENDKSWVTNRGNPKNGTNANNGSIYGTPKNRNSTGTAVPPTATPRRKPTPTHAPLVGRMVINEYLPRAGFDWNQDGLINVQDEFIEIKNLGPVNVVMNGWTLDDEEDQGSEPFSIPSMTVKPGQRVVFYGSTTGILLSDGGDTVRLLNSSGKIIDAHTYSIAEVADRSWCRIPDAPSNTYWRENCLPTPGLENTLAGVAPSEPPGTGLEVPLCKLPDTLLPDYLLAECSIGFGGDIWRPMYWDQNGWLSQYPIYDDKTKWLSFME